MMTHNSSDHLERRNDEMPTFSNQWFQRDIQPLWEKYLLRESPHYIIQTTHLPRYLELGVCEGASMLWMLEHLPIIMAVGIDAWRCPRGKAQDKYDDYRRNAMGNLAHWLANETLFLLDGKTALLLGAKLEEWHELFDLIYVDASHVAFESLLDMELSWRVLKRGGLMIVDDMNRVYNLGRAETRIAVWAFQMAYTNRFQIAFQEGRQIAFRKLK